MRKHSLNKSEDLPSEIKFKKEDIKSDRCTLSVSYFASVFWELFATTFVTDVRTCLIQFSLH